MSKANNFLKEEDAVSPVIGVILMVAITVILAAVIAAFVFGMGPPEAAPQAAVRGSAATIGTNTTIKLEHQGGDPIIFTSANTKITMDGNDVDIATDLVTEAAKRFEAGESMYLYYNGGILTLGNNSEATTAGPSAPIAIPGETAEVKIIDIASQQMIADLDVRF